MPRRPDTNPRGAPRALIVGIDCASDARNVGLALASLDHGRTKLLELCRGTKTPPIEDVITKWLGSRPTSSVLLALDAPLGWPASLGDVLSRHAAGSTPPVTAHQMFRRRTDDVVYRVLKKRPLDVGADRIARCAHAALALLQRLRD